MKKNKILAGAAVFLVAVYLIFMYNSLQNNKVSKNYEVWYTEQDMITQIDEYVDNREVYKIKRDLSTNAASEFYKTLTYKGD